ncbi:MAG: peptidyl-tRNA hydrolase [Reinekea sp.]|nr:peptidyl-tRNA hydrolase [Reinekea sp.]
MFELSEQRMVIVVRGDIVDQQGNPMPHGMAAAQAAHAAVLCSANAVLAKTVSVSKLSSEYFTKLVLRCRDFKELEHVENLAMARGLVTARMLDTNPVFYGHYKNVVTALAIGPADPDAFVSITDYLPKWENTL